MIGELSQSSLGVMLLLSVGLGFVSALLYDALRIRRKAINIPILPHFEDFLFMTAFGAALAIIFFLQNSGRFRAFAPMGALGGFYIYRKTLGRLVMAASDRIINFIRLLIKKILLPPIMAIKGAFSSLFYKIDLAYRRRATKKYIRAFAESAEDGFGDRLPKIKENKRKRKNK